MNNNRVLSDMMVFAEVARMQSYTHASKNLGLSKSAISQQVKRLEQELDEQLLVRNTRGMSLTAAGERLFRRCEVIRDQLDLARKEILTSKDEPSGRFAVTCPIDCEKDIVITALNQLCIEYPKLEPSIVATDDVKDLVRDNLDVALYNGPLKDSHYRALKVGDMHEYFCASRDYLLTFGEPKSHDEFNQHRWIVLPWNERGLRFQVAEKVSSTLSSEVNAFAKINNLSGALEMVRLGMGMAFLPSTTANKLVKAGEIKRVLPQYRGVNRPMYLIHRYPSGRPAHLERFYQLIKTQVANIV